MNLKHKARTLTLLMGFAFAIHADTSAAQPTKKSPEQHVLDKFQPELEQSADDLIATMLADAESGNPDAQYELARFYAKGTLTGIPVNFSAAVKWYRRAAEQGHVLAMAELGVMYAFGLGVEQDNAAAFTWYLAAAERGDDQSQNNVGALYFKGVVGPVNYEEAVRWYKKAADQKYGLAQANLGRMYEEGLGVPQDYLEAMRLYREASQNREVAGDAAMARLYALGRGVEKDDVEALKWSERAADSGQVAAAYNVGILHLGARGIPTDLGKALMWFIIAEELVKQPFERTNYDDAFRSQVAQSRIAAASKLSPEAVKAAEREAQQWIREFHASR